MAAFELVIKASVLIASILLGAACEHLYIKTAKRFNIVSVDSSHTVTGGGFIFPIAFTAALLTTAESVPIYFLAGLIVISVISFIDDVRGLSPVLRLLVHFACVALMLLQVTSDVGYTISLWAMALCAIGCVAIINAFNFLDGIRGITGCYSLAVLLPIFAISTVSLHLSTLALIGAVVAFSFFNFRKPERCFAGDTGSISMGFIVSYLLLSQVALPTDFSDADAATVIPDFTAITMVAVYLVDFGMTIVLRMVRRENLLTGHHNHIYQRLAYRRGISHMKIALGYAAVQLAINTIYLGNSVEFQWIFTPCTFAALVAAFGVIYKLTDTIKK